MLSGTVRKWQWFWVVGLVAALSAGAAGVLLSRGSVLKRESSAAPGDVTVLDEILALPTSCGREHCELAWRGLPLHEFRLRVLTEDLEILQDVDLVEASSFEVPSADLARVQPGDGLLWQVTAQDPDGRTLRSITYRQELE